MCPYRNRKVLLAENWHREMGKDALCPCPEQLAIG